MICSGYVVEPCKADKGKCNMTYVQQLSSDVLLYFAGDLMGLSNLLLKLIESFRQFVLQWGHDFVTEWLVLLGSAGHVMLRSRYSWRCFSVFRMFAFLSLQKCWVVIQAASSCTGLPCIPRHLKLFMHSPSLARLLVLAAKVSPAIIEFVLNVSVAVIF